MNTVMGVAAFHERMKVAEISVQALLAFDLRLGSGIWDIGIDQSTSCTGICLERVDKKINVLLDVKRDRSVEDRIFYRDLFQLLQKIAQGGEKFRYIVMEKPAPKDMYASRVLQELKGRVEEWVDFIPQFEDCIVDSLYQQTWKSYVIDKSKGKNRGKYKRSIAEDLVDKFPLFLDYFLQYPYSDYDSFDACGILYGFKHYAFDEKGREKIHGVKEKTHVTLVGYWWTEDLKEIGEKFNDFFTVKKPKILEFNERYNLHDNIRMASSNEDFALTVLPKKELGQFMWKYDVDTDNRKGNMVMFVLRKGRASNAEIEWFKELLPWNEEVYAE